MTDVHLIFGILSGVLTVAFVVPYMRDILYGNTRPNVISWGIWTVLEVIAVFAQISAGASYSLIVLLAVTFNTALITILACVGYGHREYGRTDFICFAFALAALALWYFTGSPTLAIVFTIIADVFAAVPTIVKSYRDPGSEHLPAWSLIAVGSVCGIFASSIFNIANLAYPVYLFLQQAAVVLAILVGRKHDIHTGQD